MPNIYEDILSGVSLFCAYIHPTVFVTCTLLMSAQSRLYFLCDGFVTDF